MTQKKTLDEKMTSFSLRKAASDIGKQYRDTPAHEPVKTEKPDVDEKNYTRFNFICDKELVRKVKAVATKEGITIRQIMEKSMTDWLAKYEKKNGPIGDVKARSIEDL